MSLINIDHKKYCCIQGLIKKLYHSELIIKYNHQQYQNYQFEMYKNKTVKNNKLDPFI